MVPTYSSVNAIKKLIAFLVVFTCRQLNDFIPAVPTDQHWFCKAQTLIGLNTTHSWKRYFGNRICHISRVITPLQFCMCICLCRHVYMSIKSILLAFVRACVHIYIHTLYKYMHKITLFGKLFYSHNHIGLKFGVYLLFPNTIFQPFSSVYFFEMKVFVFH